MLALLLGRKRDFAKDHGQNLIQALDRIDEDVAAILRERPQIKDVANQTYEKENFLYLGRGINFPVALEGALKLKEISYIHAEGYPAAEMKHGPIALIDENMPIVFIAPQDATFQKIIANIQEVKARKGPVLAIAPEGVEIPEEAADDIFRVPSAHEIARPIVATIPLQLFAYHFARIRGLDVDKPRNLAKSVTVE